MELLWRCHRIVLLLLLREARLISGLQCNECLYDEFNTNLTIAEKAAEREVCLLNLEKVNCDHLNRVAEDSSRGKKAFLVKYTGPNANGVVALKKIETGNYAISRNPAVATCALEMATVNGYLVYMRKACSLTAEPLTCEFLEREGGTQKAKVALCYCDRDECNNASKLEELPMTKALRRGAENTSNIEIY